MGGKTCTGGTADTRNDDPADNQTSTPTGETGGQSDK